MASEAEIAVLEALAAQGEILRSKPAACTPAFHSRLRLVDRNRRTALLDRCSNDAANTALLALRDADLEIEWGEWRIAFEAKNLTAVSHAGSEAIRLDLPNSVSISRRRIYPRTEDPRPPLRCELYSGAAAEFVAAVTDVSQGGIGLEMEPDAALTPGTMLARCRINSEAGETLTVDLEVRHTVSVTLPGGRKVFRAGCRFLNMSPAAMAVITKYAITKHEQG